MDPEQPIDLGGAFVAAVTPFDSDSGDIDLAAHASNVRAWSEAGVRGVLIAGSTGEAVFLTDVERRLLIETARGAVAERQVILAGTGAESTRGTLDLTKQASDTGADAALVLPPAYYKGAMTAEALKTHFLAVADGSPIPVIVYQVPLRLSTLELETGLVAELSRHENVVGIKDSRGKLDELAALVEAAQRGFQVLVGSGSKLYAGLEVGAVGGILGVANLMPAEAQAIVSEWKAGRHLDAGRLQERVGPLHEAVVGRFGVPGVKAGLDLIGMHGGKPRPPLLPLGDAQRSDVRKAIGEAGILVGA